MLSAALVFSLAACGTQGSQNSSLSESEETAASETAGGSEDSDVSEAAAEPEEPTEGIGRTLVAYFSWSGNTAQMAQMIQEETGADLFEIEPAEPYTDDYNTLLDVARQEQDDNARPEVASQVENWDSYNVVFVGYPKMEQGFLSV